MFPCTGSASLPHVPDLDSTLRTVLTVIYCSVLQTAPFMSVQYCAVLFTDPIFSLFSLLSHSVAAFFVICVRSRFLAPVLRMAALEGSFDFDPSL